VIALSPAALVARRVPLVVTQVDCASLPAGAARTGAGTAPCGDRAWIAGERSAVVFPARPAVRCGAGRIWARRAGGDDRPAGWLAPPRLVLDRPGRGAVDAELEVRELAPAGRCLVSTWASRRIPSLAIVQELALAADPSGIAIRTTVRTGEPVHIACFSPVTVLAGEGATARERSEALFPGLEWLGPGERSSSDAAIDADHPLRVRCVPHPNMVTVPAMAVRSGDITVGLLWDPRNRWDGTSDRPSPVFDSPNRIDGQANHLLALMLPPVPAWTPAGSRTARTPYLLVPGRTIAIEAVLVAEAGAPDALTAIDCWYRLHGPRSPARLPRGTPAREVAFSLRAVLDTLWEPGSRGWWGGRCAPLQGETPRPVPEFLWDLDHAGPLAADAATRARARARRVEAGGGPAILEEDELASVAGAGPDRVAGAVARARSLVSRQRPDGAWAFDPPPGLAAALGAPGTVEAGTIARPAFHVLRAARLSGDARLVSSGLAALRALERFSIPRGAQSWEVPLAAPDLLAAADAIEACVEGASITGDPAWLARAAAWCRRALPFVYAWQDPAHRWMSFASVPAFGASFRRHAWFGVAVPWNGLVLARAADRLASAIEGRPEAASAVRRDAGPAGWLADPAVLRDLAARLLASACWTQETASGAAGLLPDSISTIDGRSSELALPPHRLLLALVGRTQVPPALEARD
jgi:hypothetical protein